MLVQVVRLQAPVPAAHRRAVVLVLHSSRHTCHPTKRHTVTLSHHLGPLPLRRLTFIHNKGQPHSPVGTDGAHPLQSLRRSPEARNHRSRRIGHRKADEVDRAARRGMRPLSLLLVVLLIYERH